MKCLVLALLLFVSYSGAARAQTEGRQSDLEQAGLAGRVRSVDSWRVEYTIKDGRSVEGRRIPSRKTTYDERGNRAEEVSYDQNGAPQQRLVYTYDAQGRGTGYEEYSSLLDKGLSKPRRHVYKLDEAGRKVEYTVYESDGSLGSRFTYAYDAAGRKTEEAYYNWQGVRTGRLVYTYGEGGRLLTQTSRDEGDAVVWKRVNAYGEGGRVSEAAQYQGETLRYSFSYRYDGKGRPAEVETREFNAVPGVYVTHSPVPGKVVYTYDDEKGTKEAATYDASGVLKKRLRYSLDENGNEAGATELNPDGSAGVTEIRWYDRNVLLRAVEGTTSAEFVRDARGNWTRKTLLVKPAGAEKPEPYRAEVREIVYY